jgi:hypothetical protein
MTIIVSELESYIKAMNHSQDNSNKHIHTSVKSVALFETNKHYKLIQQELIWLCLLFLEKKVSRDARGSIASELIYTRGGGSALRPGPPSPALGPA